MFHFGTNISTSTTLSCSRLCKNTGRFSTSSGFKNMNASASVQKSTRCSSRPPCISESFNLSSFSGRHLLYLKVPSVHQLLQFLCLYVFSTGDIQSNHTHFTFLTNDTTVLRWQTIIKFWFCLRRSCFLSAVGAGASFLCVVAECVTASSVFLLLKEQEAGVADG